MLQYMYYFAEGDVITQQHTQICIYVCNTHLSHVKKKKKTAPLSCSHTLRLLQP